MMYTDSPVSLLYFYGSFLIICSIMSVMLIGRKAKTALISGGSSGALALFIAYSLSLGKAEFKWAGIFVAFCLFAIFSWRSCKTLFKVFELIPSSHPDLRGKGIAFLIISLMAVVSLVVFILQVVTVF